MAKFGHIITTFNYNKRSFIPTWAVVVAVVAPSFSQTKAFVLSGTFGGLFFFRYLA